MRDIYAFPDILAMKSFSVGKQTACILLMQNECRWQAFCLDESSNTVLWINLTRCIVDYILAGIVIKMETQLAEVWLEPL
jgi:hypothetical protein